jgi:hypothetical protein
MVVAMDDLNCEVRDVAFEANVFNAYSTFDHIAKKSIKDLGYAYSHCELLNKATLTTIMLKIKSPHIKMHEHFLQKNMYVRVEKFGIKSKFKSGFNKDDMTIIITF